MRLSLAALLVLLRWTAFALAEERAADSVGMVADHTAQSHPQGNAGTVSEESEMNLGESLALHSNEGGPSPASTDSARSLVEDELLSLSHQDQSSEDAEDGIAAYESVLQEMLRVVAMEEEEEHQWEAAMLAEAREQHHVEYEPPFDFRSPREDAGLGKQQQQQDGDGSFAKTKGSTLRSAKASSVPLDDSGLRNTSRGRVPGERRQSGGSYFGESRQQQASVPTSEIRAMEDLGRSFGIELDLATKEERRRKAVAEQERARRREEERVLRMRVRRRYASPVEDVLRHVDLENPAAVFDPYKVLGVSRHASHSDIKRVFRARVVAVHPDKNPHPVRDPLPMNEAQFCRMRSWPLMRFTMRWRFF